MQTPAATVAPINWLMMYSTASGGAMRPVDRKPERHGRVMMPAADPAKAG